MAAVERMLEQSVCAKCGKRVYYACIMEDASNWVGRSRRRYVLCDQDTGQEHRCAVRDEQ